MIPGSFWHIVSLLLDNTILTDIPYLNIVFHTVTMQVIGFSFNCFTWVSGRIISCLQIYAEYCIEDEQYLAHRVSVI